MTINDKPWTSAKEVCRALKYNKKTVDLRKSFCDQEHYAQKHQLIKFSAAGNFVNWQKDSRKDDYCINNEGMYELILASQQPKSKDFRKHCCNVMFLLIRQQLIKKMEKDYQKVIEDKRYTALALLNYDLQEQISTIQAIQYENVVL